jgi:hypothetical protein
MIVSETNVHIAIQRHNSSRITEAVAVDLSEEKVAVEEAQNDQ